MLSKAETMPVAATAARNGPKARMWRLLLKEAGAMLCEGETPSVAEVAARAGVSRATAYRYTFPRFKEYEPQLRAALLLSLEHGAQERAGTLAEEPYRRGHRVKILSHAAAPLKPTLGKKRFDRLVRALSVIYGIEGYVVLRDIWGSSDREIEGIVRWIADALVDTALREAGANGHARKRNGRG